MMSAFSKRVLSQLLLRLLLLLVLLGGLGGLVALNGELTRASVSMSLARSLQLFMVGLPGVLVQLLPLCGVLALIGFGATHRSSQSWMAQRLAGRGGRALLVPVGIYAAIVAIGMGVLGGSFLHRMNSLSKELVVEHARVVPGQAMILGEVEIMASAGTLVEMQDVVVSTPNPPMIGASREAILDRQRGVLSLRDGVLFQESDPPMELRFLQMELGLGERVSDPSLHVLKSRFEGLKRWTWPLMAGLLFLIVLPDALRGRPTRAFSFWLLAWGIVRVCDHHLVGLGLVSALLLPPAILSACVVVQWSRWEDA